jgi:tetratricopeptide (TPR) repeat protein
MIALPLFRRIGVALGVVCLLLPVACGQGGEEATVADARALFEKGEPDAAEEAARELMRKELDAAARADLAELFIDLQRAELAVEVVRAGGEVSPEGRAALGQALIRLGKLVEAEIEIDSLGGGLEPRGTRLRGQLALARGRTDEALSFFEAALRAAPDDVRSSYWLALGLVQKGRLLEAQAELSRALATSRDDPDLRSLLAWALLLDMEGADAFDPERISRVIDLLRPVERRRPRDADSRERLGQAQFLAGKHVEAERVLRRLVADHPGRARAWNFLGLSLQAQGEVRDAVEAFAHATARQPNDVPLLLNLGHALYALGDQVHDWEEPLSRARDVFRRAAELEPNGPHAWKAWLGLADCSLKLDPTSDPEAGKAIGLCRKALEVRPDCWPAHVKMGVIYYDVWGEGEGYRKALEHFDAAARIRPPKHWLPGSRRTYEFLKEALGGEER